MRIVSTPLDAELARLNAEMASTIVAYGSSEQQKEVGEKVLLAESLSAPAAADRLAFMSSIDAAVAGAGDLVADSAVGKVQINHLPDAKLPGRLRGRSSVEKAEFLAVQGEKRKEIQHRIQELLMQRAQYLQAEAARPGADRQRSFGSQIHEIMKAQAAKKGIRY